MSLRYIHYYALNYMQEDASDIQSAESQARTAIRKLHSEYSFDNKAILRDTEEFLNRLKKQANNASQGNYHNIAQELIEEAIAETQKSFSEATTSMVNLGTLGIEAISGVNRNVATTFTSSNFGQSGITRERINKIVSEFKKQLDTAQKESKKTPGNIDKVMQAKQNIEQLEKDLDQAETEWRAGQTVIKFPDGKAEFINRLNLISELINSVPGLAKTVVTNRKSNIQGEFFEQLLAGVPGKIAYMAEEGLLKDLKNLSGGVGSAQGASAGSKVELDLNGLETDVSQLKKALQPIMKQQYNFEDNGFVAVNDTLDKTDVTWNFGDGQQPMYISAKNYSSLGVTLVSGTPLAVQLIWVSSVAPDLLYHYLNVHAIHIDQKVQIGDTIDRYMKVLLGISALVGAYRINQNQKTNVFIINHTTGNIIVRAMDDLIDRIYLMVDDVLSFEPSKIFKEEFLNNTWADTKENRVGNILAQAYGLKLSIHSKVKLFA